MHLIVFVHNTIIYTTTFDYTANQNQIGQRKIQINEISGKRIFKYYVALFVSFYISASHPENFLRIRKNRKFSVGIIGDGTKNGTTVQIPITYI